MSAAPTATPTDRQTLKETTMYHRRMQHIRRSIQHRRVHEAQRAERAAAEREQMRAFIHAQVR